MKDINTQIKECKEKLLHSGVICFPTETVMGLAVIYNDFNAYQKLNIVKNRPEDKPYTMMVKSIEDISKYAYVDENISRLIHKYMPGSLTLLLKAKDNVPGYVTHNTGIIGIRIPSNEVALKLLKEVDIPLLVPSANKSGCKPCYNSQEAKEVFNNELDYIIEGESISNVPSTIVDVTKDNPLIIREGKITKEEIFACFNNKN